MLTQIEIDGFKTFKDFKVELAPFQVIVGPNGSGKSNLFDALQLLSRLADKDLLTAFQEMRGDAGELFTKYPDGKTSDHIRIAVEMLVDRKMQDDLGGKAELEYTRLRYVLEVTLRKDEHGLLKPYVTYESLVSILYEEDAWCKRYGLLPESNWLSKSSSTQATFIETVIFIGHVANVNPNKPNNEIEVTEISLYREGGQIRRQFMPFFLKRTVLSSVGSIEDPYVYAVHKELSSLKFLHLHPDVLRQPSSLSSPSILSVSGANLPTTLARIQAEDKFAFDAISLDMANLVPDMLDIEVEEDQTRKEYRIRSKTSDQRSFSAQVLSDGTLRLLALATLRNDPQFHGTLCLEEPENGVQPLHLKKMARLLREMATDFNDPEQVNDLLKQVLITTHSPLFISQPDVIDSLLLTLTPTHIQGKGAVPLRVTRMARVITPDMPPGLEEDVKEDKALEAYTIDMVRKYLDSDTLDAAHDQLKQARRNLLEG